MPALVRMDVPSDLRMGKTCRSGRPAVIRQALECGQLAADCANVIARDATLDSCLDGLFRRIGAAAVIKLRQVLDEFDALT